MKKINSTFLTLEEYRLLWRLTPETVKNLDKATFMGRKAFKQQTSMEIILESPYLFYDIKNGRTPIFVLNKPLNVSTNDLKQIGRERLYKTGGRGSKYYYKYKGKKYIQKERFDRTFGVWTRTFAPIYPYVTLKELKSRLKVRGFKRIVRKTGVDGYVLKPFNLTYNEKKLKKRR